MLSCINLVAATIFTLQNSKVSYKKKALKYLLLVNVWAFGVYLIFNMMNLQMLEF